MEILLGKVDLLKPKDHSSLPARHEASLLKELQSVLISASKRRSRELEAAIFPRCQGLIEAIGHHIAYDAAIEVGVDQRIINMYVAGVIEKDPVWYSEHGGIPRKEQKEMRTRSVETLLPCLTLSWKV